MSGRRLVIYQSTLSANSGKYSENIRTRGEGWLDVERAAVTSGDKDFPVEVAFISGDARGWRAAAPGSQTIRLIFDRLQTLRCISLVFEENETGRTQEFSIAFRLGDNSPLISAPGVRLAIQAHAKSCTDRKSSRIEVR
jgi:hypothetical protein